MSTLPVSVCLHALSHFSQKTVSITSPSVRPKICYTFTLTALECLSNFLPANLLAFVELKTEQEMIICISANLSSQTLADKMNAVKT